MICTTPGDWEKPIHQPHVLILNHDQSHEVKAVILKWVIKEWLKSQTLGLYCTLILKYSYFENVNNALPDMQTAFLTRHCIMQTASSGRTRVCSNPCSCSTYSILEQISSLAFTYTTHSMRGPMFIQYGGTLEEAMCLCAENIWYNDYLFFYI